MQFGEFGSFNSLNVDYFRHRPVFQQHVSSEFFVATPGIQAIIRKLQV
jgi:hypothetical protein